jgi:hypothetical protein
MKKMKRTLLLFLLSVATILVSCNPITTGSYYIDNNSNSTIYVKQGNVVDTVPSHKIQKVFVLSGRNEGQAVQEGLFEKIYNDTADCKKEMVDGNNWITANVKKNEYTHHFVVFDADF